MAGGGGSGSSGAAGTTGKAGSSGSAGAGAGSGAAGTTGTGGTTGAGGSKADGGAGTSGTTDAGAAPLVYAGYIENLLVLNCGGCHVAVNGKTMGNFAFSYTSLLATVNAEHAGCPNLDASKKRVVPGKPENSLLYIKASLPNPPSACGGHMPFAGQMLGDSTLKLIYDWIKQGANP